MEFAPYGLMPASWGGNEDLKKPEAFRMPGGLPASEALWTEWIEGMADEMATFLWPRWQQGKWCGASAASMQVLSEADLALMPKLAPRLDESPSGVRITHRALFVIEDLKPPNSGGFLHYAPQAPQDLLKHFDSLLLAGGGDNARPASLNLKRRMQRPRPYQVALQLLGAQAQDFEYLSASSATSPSLVSGHCIQGAMALVHMVVEHERSFGTLAPAVLDPLCRYFIDTGDRRVFAGVHYPSDNLSSWFVALRLCRHVFDPDRAERAREVLRRGIEGSDVFLAMKQAVRDEPTCAFAAPMERLWEELTQT